MTADHPNGFLHQVQTEAGDFYWISTKNVERPLGRGFETMILGCRKDGYASKKAVANAEIIHHGGYTKAIEKKHREICGNLEKYI